MHSIGRSFPPRHPQAQCVFIMCQFHGAYMLLAMFFPRPLELWTNVDHWSHIYALRYFKSLPCQNLRLKFDSNYPSGFFVYISYRVLLYHSFGGFTSPHRRQYSALAWLRPSRPWPVTSHPPPAPATIDSSITRQRPSSLKYFYFRSTFVCCWALGPSFCFWALQPRGGPSSPTN